MSNFAVIIANDGLSHESYNKTVNEEAWITFYLDSLYSVWLFLFTPLPVDVWGYKCQIWNLGQILDLEI